MSVRCAIVPPTPVPYREPLFRALNERPELEICVIYQSAAQPSWDVPAEWFPREHPYPAAHLRAWQRRRSGRTPVLWPRGLERALRAADPDCVVVSEYGPASLRVQNWCRRHHRAYVIFTECTPVIDGMLPGWQLALHRRLARQADGIIAASSSARERLRAFGVPDERIAVALQAADVHAFRAVARNRTQPAVAPNRIELAPNRTEPAPNGTESAVAPNRRQPLTVLTVGRLVPDKNFATLIEAFARLRAEAGPDGLHGAAELEIVGTGFLQDELERLARHHAVPARFRGHLPPEQMPDLYAKADVYASISTYEPFGVAVREAAAAGLPIICSRTAGAAGDVAIEGRNALLVDPHSVDEVASALARLASDPELRRRMGEESRAIDGETDGREVDAYADAVLAAARRRGRAGPQIPADVYEPSSAGSTSA